MTEQPPDPRLTALDVQFQSLAAEHVKPSRPIASDVVRALRAEGGLLTTRVTPDGVDRISEGAVASALARAARDVQGVEHASVRVDVDAAGELLVRVEIVAMLGAKLPPLAGAVRAAVVRASERATGLPASVVDVHVDDVV